MSMANDDRGTTNCSTSAQEGDLDMAEQLGSCRPVEHRRQQTQLAGGPLHLQAPSQENTAAEGGTDGVPSKTISAQEQQPMKFIVEFLSQRSEERETVRWRGNSHQTATYALGVGSADAAGGRLLLVEQAEVGLGTKAFGGDVETGAGLTWADNDNLNGGETGQIVRRAARGLKARCWEIIERAYGDGLLDSENSGGEDGDDDGADDLHG
ncbi:hypothetical protein BDK51DRAFT_53254 [Blyttiomyces helicus]|uniref:Uncharacterized protein n=1 Tax=Blyttiomyces helicus TaxID=388810 RepID=A0A4P9WLD3_9FUNG|nr:hypothetical protein BDK51DRAFT_53254 [Blyttiomyces helicus]|eukprot:RKO93222.1 hypothetical protein BDK51DRAFT_53254 [Blyttiomyces helicus]